MVDGGNLSRTGVSVKKTARAGRRGPGFPGETRNPQRAQYSNCSARRRPQRHGSQPSSTEINKNTPQAA